MYTPSDNGLTIIACGIKHKPNEWVTMGNYNKNLLAYTHLLINFAFSVAYSLSKYIKTDERV